MSSTLDLLLIFCHILGLRVSTHWADFIFCSDLPLKIRQFSISIHHLSKRTMHRAPSGCQRLL